jgi:lipid II isoglutaminyl synthase (glutamine-hydrolysing)
VSIPGADSSLTIAVVYPDLLGTYGDGGNGLVLARRASWRGIGVQLIQANSGRPLPTADIYCIGGGEDGPGITAAKALRADGTLQREAGQGAVVLGVCAGFQLLGHSFPDSADRSHQGLELLDVTTHKGPGRRAVGDLVAVPTPYAPRRAADQPLPPLIGFENHSGVTTIGPEARPVAQVVAGVGNGGGDGTEGAWSSRVFGTYLHGPVLARNTSLADLLLGWALSTLDGPVALEPLDDAAELALRGERMAAVERSGRSRVVRWFRGLRP